MKFDIITIFPNIFVSYFSESILKRACKKKIIEINVHDLRNFAFDKRRTVDDRPYGGGPGMVLKVEPIHECVKFVKSESASRIRKNGHKKLKDRVILFSAKGKQFTQQEAKRFSKYDNLIFICGRYEGVDERVALHIADEEISVGNYVLTGGEIPALIVIDVVARLIPGVLGNFESLKTESHSRPQLLEHPHYTKPEIYNDWKVPSVLLSGNHEEIKKWRKLNQNKKRNK